MMKGEGVWRRGEGNESVRRYSTVRRDDPSARRPPHFPPPPSTMPEYTTAVRLAAPPTEVFDYLTRPENVMAVTDASAGITLLSGPEVMGRRTSNELEVRGFDPRSASPTP